MRDAFVEREWAELCKRVRETAQHLADGNADAASFPQEAENFCNQTAPERYPELLGMVAEAAKMAISWQEKVGGTVASQPTKLAKAQSSGSADPRQQSEAELDEAGDESFPASDPPAWTATTIS